ncbi:unnamed protein product, partial [Aphanomyces euteiches]
ALHLQIRKEMSKIPVKKQSLSPAEKLMIVRVHAHFMQEASKLTQGKSRAVRKAVAECLGVRTRDAPCNVYFPDRMGSLRNEMDEGGMYLI